jgi:putative peptidoglycan lipid II flippase
MFTICLLALGSAALNCKGHFAYPAFAPILLNVFMIAAAVTAHRLDLGDSWRGLFLLSGAVIVAGVTQLIGVVWLLRATGLAVVPGLRPILPEVRRIARLILPMMVPLGILQFSAFFDRIYAWWMTSTHAGDTLEIFGLSIARPLQEGVVTCLYAANRLFQFPLGILAISLATAVFPLLSRYASRGDVAGLRDATNRALRLSLFMGIPAGAALVVLARPVTELICGRGRFTAYDIDRVAYVLRMYCLGMWAYFCNHILLRAFFSQKDTITPLKVSCSLALVNMALVATLIFTPLRSGAIGLASAATAGATTLLLTRILRRRWGRIGLRRIVASLARTLAATAAMVGALLLVQTCLGPAAARLAEAWRRGWVDEAIVVLAGVVVGAGVFFVAARAMRCSEIRELLGAVRRRGDAEAQQSGGTQGGNG